MIDIASAKAAYLAVIILSDNNGELQSFNI